MDGGSLQDIVDHGGNDDESALANIAVQALKGLSFLHNHNQIHRDLKPGNFLISHRGEVKVADLGILKQLPPKAPGVLQKTKTFVGTATYMSPERIDGKEYGFPSDVWALGLSLMTIALGKIPFDTEGGYWTILKNIRDAPSPTLPADKFSTEFRDFINLCMKKNPDDRATCKELLNHPFMSKVAAEDLTYKQSYERGRSELIQIVEAMVTHIDQLKTDALTKFCDSDNFLNLTPRLDGPISDGTKQAYTQSTSAAHEKLFGNLLEMSTVDIMKRILFDERRPTTAGGTNRLTKPRLGTLARQLHLPLDRVNAETRTFLDNLIRSGSPGKNH
jgi:serine/threonine protein kinase